MHNIKEILEAKDFIMSKTDQNTVIGLILGSGLGSNLQTILKMR